MNQNYKIIYNSIFFDRLTANRNVSSSCITLYYPKKIHNNTVVVNLQQKIYYPTSIHNTPNLGYTKNLNNRLEKKYKNNKNLLVDRLDLRKYKNTLKSKSRSKIQIRDDDLHTDYNDNVESIINTDRSTIRSFKQLKNKKIVKTSLRQKCLNQKNILIDPQHQLQSIQYIDPNQILISGKVSIYELASVLSVSITEVIKCLFLKGMRITINTLLDMDTAKLVAESYDYSVTISNNTEYTQNVNKIIDKVKQQTLLYKRAPIITVLGHVDHGKTTLLDTICQKNVSVREKGGITQAIYAHEVEVTYHFNKEKLIFLDTPGHSAFSAMRTISAQVTDIGILVVAADDGLQEQTFEILENLNQNKISYIIAINKIDKSNANVSKIRKELTKIGIVDSNIPILEVSSLTKQNINKLLDTIVELANSKSLKANPIALASGTILDSYINRKKGPIATILIQDGTIRTGDLLVARNVVTKVRAIINNNNLKVEDAGPSSVVEIWGLSHILCSGDQFSVISNNKHINKQLYNYKAFKNSSQSSNVNNSYSKYQSSNQLYYNNNKYLNIIVKTENQASIDAILKTFNDIPQKKVRLNIMSISTGEVTINDIKFASISNSVVIGFNNNSTILNIKLEAEKSNVSVVNFTVIYDLFDYIKNLMLDLVDIEHQENVIGNAIVESTFVISKGLVAGCSIISGYLKQNSYIKVIRNKNIVYNGKLSSLKKVKEEVKQVFQGHECGILAENFNMWQKKDEVLAYELIPQEKQL